MEDLKAKRMRGRTARQTVQVKVLGGGGSSRRVSQILIVSIEKDKPVSALVGTET